MPVAVRVAPLAGAARCRSYAARPLSPSGKRARRAREAPGGTPRILNLGFLGPPCSESQMIVGHYDLSHPPRNQTERTPAVPEHYSPGAPVAGPSIHPIYSPLSMVGPIVKINSHVVGGLLLSYAQSSSHDHENDHVLPFWPGD